MPYGSDTQVCPYRNLIIPKMNTDKRNRKSLRLKDYDYSQPGYYYVTLCVQNRECLFGYIKEGKMEFSDAGKMIQKWWCELTNKYPTLELDTFQIMPNHIHGILIIQPVGANLCVRPIRQDSNLNVRHNDIVRQTGQTHRSAPTLGTNVQWFKTMATNEYIRGVKQKGWEPFRGKLLQRNYYERVIRNEKELEKIRKYIAENPAKWAEDEYNPDNIKKR